MEEARKRRKIKAYFEGIKKYNKIKKRLQYLIIIFAFFSGILFMSGITFASDIFLFGLFVSLLAYIPRLPVSEKTLDRWLEADRRRLDEKAEGKLALLDETFRTDVDIPVRRGVYRYSINYISGLKDLKEWGYIDPKDFFSEKGVDGKQRFGVYPFGKIVLCQNFLAYYKCYWNFVKGASINDESSELLYVTITSVRYNEISDLNLKRLEESEELKELLKELKDLRAVKKIKLPFFTITTEDSSQVTFYFGLDIEVAHDSKGYISDSDELSDIEKTVQQLRRQLRQRRIDYQQVRAIDSDFNI